VNDDVQAYDGTTAVVRTQQLEAEEIEFLRWQAERWMKLRHLPPVFLHDPGFVLRNGMRMLQHTFRGSTLKTWLGLENEREAFRRYRALRQREREYLPETGRPAVRTAQAMPA